MTKISVGDKVKFLNEKGGGVVTRLKDHQTAMVQVDDGFEIPVLMKDLIVHEAASANPAPSAEQATPAETRLRRSPHMATGVYLAFVRTAGSKIAGAADLFLLNNTDHDILYNILSGDNEQFQGFDYGSAAPRSKVLLQKCPENSGERLLKGTVQILYHPLRPGRILPPLQSEFRMKATRLLEESNYADSGFFDGPDILLFLGYQNQEVQETTVTKASEQKNESEKLLNRYKTSEGEAVIDLHIEALTDDVRRVSPQETLQIQLAHFERITESSLKQGYRKLIFIHGVGNGILKSEIRRKLSEMEGVIFFDAPYLQYGVGATEVQLP